MTELEEEAEKGEDSQTGKASDTNTQVQCPAALSRCGPPVKHSDRSIWFLIAVMFMSDYTVSV
jgi:hypothetical protein